MTLGTWLENARRSLHSLPDEPTSSVYAIASFILNQPAYWPQAHPDFRLSPALLEKLNLSFERLLKGEPLPYITSTRAFFNLDFFVTPDVLIPRPETELLVETALNRLPSLNKPCLVADVGTGSGCIAITLACHQPSCRLIATDISYKSLLVARENCRRYTQLERISLVQTDLLAGIQANFDLICANLPYIPTDKLAHLEVTKHEPLLALDGGPQGLDAIARLVEQAKSRLKPGGILLLEMESSQSEGIRKVIHASFPKAGITIIDDLNRLPRLAMIEN